MANGADIPSNGPSDEDLAYDLVGDISWVRSFIITT